MDDSGEMSNVTLRHENEKLRATRDCLERELREAKHALDTWFEAAVEFSQEIERLREGLDTVYETFQKEASGFPLEYMLAVTEYAGELVGKGEFAALAPSDGGGDDSPHKKKEGP